MTDEPLRFDGSDLNQSLLNKAVSDKYQLILTVPEIMKGLVNEAMRTKTKASFNSVLFSGKNVVVPAQSVKKKDLGFAAQKMPISSFARDAMPEVTVEFTVDNNFNNYHYLWMWLECLNNAKDAMPRDGYFNPNERTVWETSRMGGTDAGDEPFSIKVKKFAYQHKFFDYQCGIVLNILREYEEPIARFVYTNAFITELGDLKLDYASADPIKCYFKFAFGQQYFDILLRDTSIPKELK